MSRYYLYVDDAPIIFAARTNMAGAITYPLSQLTFDTVTTGAYTDIEADMTLLLGTSAGDDSLGRVRVQNIATATTIPVPLVSQGTNDGELDAGDNLYISVLNDYRVWAKIPFIDSSGVQYKDRDVPVGTYTSTGIPPVANCGPGTAGTIDSGTSLLTVDFDGTASLAVAVGATISTYAWDVDDGTITVGTSASSSITATFPAGFRWVSLTVTDSNAIPHTARCPVFARDPAADVTIDVFDFETSIEASGQEMNIRVFEPVTFPDGALVMLWEDEPFNAADRGHIHLIGWQQSEDAESRATRTGNTTATTLHCVDIAGRLKTLPGFPQSLERSSTINNWDRMTAPTMDRYVHYLLQWHSTALSLADYAPSDTGDDYPFVIFASEGASLFEQVESDVSGLVPTHHFTCNRQGQLFVNVDPMLQDSADRTANVIGAFNEANLENIRFTYTRPPRVHWLRGHALLTATGYTSVDGTDTLLTVHCIAPGDAPGQGVDAVETNEGLAQSQAALNNAKGHEYARRNSRYGTIAVTPPDDSVYIDVEPAQMEWVTLTLTAATAAQHGLTFATTRCLVTQIRRRVAARPTGSFATSEFDLEVETTGGAAATVEPVGTGFSPYVPGGPPDYGLITGAELVAAIASDGLLYTTSDFQTVSGSGGPTWTETDLSITDTKLFSFVVDPFSPGYTNGTGAGAINGWVVGETNIWRITDMFGTPGAAIVHTFSTVISASSVFVSRTIGASFGRYFATEADNPWLLCISHYADAVGHTGTWATYSLDAGVTWATEVEITPYYDTDSTGNDPANIPMLYMSPRTPGLAYSAAYTETATPANAVAMVTTDWGQTWAEASAAPTDSASEPLPRWGTSLGSGDFTLGALTGRADASQTHVAPPTGATSKYLMLAPPKTAARVEVAGTWSASLSRTGPSDGLGGGQIIISKPATVTLVDDLTYTAPAMNSTSSGSFTMTLTFAGGDWPQFNTETALSSPPTGPAGVSVQVRADAQATGASGTVTNIINVTLTVTEIELDDATVYTPPTGGVSLFEPVNRLGGDVHIPWADNSSELVVYSGQVTRGATLAYALLRADGDGVTVTDVSPAVSARNYGINGYGFAVRAYDSDRQKVIVAGRGNGVDADTANDYVGVWVSSNAGTTWANIVSVANSTAEYRAAFGGDDSDIIYIWGPTGYMGYSSNFGTAIDSRAGNLAALGAVNTIGIAGGPTA